MFEIALFSNFILEKLFNLKFLKNSPDVFFDASIEKTLFLFDKEAQ